MLYTMQIEATACWRRGVARVVNGNYAIDFTLSVRQYERYLSTAFKRHALARKCFASLLLCRYHS